MCWQIKLQHLPEIYGKSVRNGQTEDILNQYTPLLNFFPYFIDTVSQHHPPLQVTAELLALKGTQMSQVTNFPSSIFLNAEGSMPMHLVWDNTFSFSC